MISDGDRILVGLSGDKDRAKNLTDKALDYALRAMCIRKPDTCLFRQSSFQEFKNTVSTLGVKDLLNFVYARLG